MATPAGIRHAYHISRSTMKVKQWDRVALKGRTYIYTEKGPFKQRFHKIGRADPPICKCGQVQNAAHILPCGWVVGGGGLGEQTTRVLQQRLA